jgi:hypothetical protein
VKSTRSRKPAILALTAFALAAALAADAFAGSVQGTPLPGGSVT